MVRKQRPKSLIISFKKKLVVPLNLGLVVPLKILVLDSIISTVDEKYQKIREGEKV